MRERPIGELVRGLRQLGADVRTPAREGYPPVEIAACGLEGGVAEVAASTSSQFVSAMLLAAPLARCAVTLELTGEVVSRPFIKLTEDLMREFGVEVEHVPRPEGAEALRVKAPATYRAGVHRIQGDATAATYFWAAAAVTGGRVRVENVGTRSSQGDARFVDVLERMGCDVKRSAHSCEVSRPEALAGGRFDLNAMPDTVPTLAVVAAFAEGPTEIVNVANLRVKECDRLAALAAELPELGAKVEERPDGLLIVPPAGGREALRGARISTYNDHRMAMSFAVAGLAVPGIEIEDPKCVEKTYPRFFEDLALLGTARR